MPIFCPECGLCLLLQGEGPYHLLASEVLLLLQLGFLHFLFTFAPGGWLQWHVLPDS